MINRIEFTQKSELKLRQQAVFLSRLSELIREGYTFHDSVVLLLPHHMKDFERALEEIENGTREGEGVTDTLRRLGFSSSTLLSVSISELNGSLPDALLATSSRIDRIQRTERKLKRVSAYPAFLSILLLLLLLAYRSYFLPNMAHLIRSKAEPTGVASILPQIASRLPDVFLILILCLTAMVASGYFLLKKASPEAILKTASRIPVIGHFYSNWNSYKISREVGALLVAGFSLQQALNILSKQEFDRMVQYVASSIQYRIGEGVPFEVAVLDIPSLSKQFAIVIQHGSFSGYLGKELLVYSSHLEETIDLQLKQLLAILQPAMFIIIALCILVAYLALLLPVYDLLNTI